MLQRTLLIILALATCVTVFRGLWPTGEESYAVEVARPHHSSIREFHARDKDVWAFVDDVVKESFGYQGFPVILQRYPETGLLSLLGSGGVRAIITDTSSDRLNGDTYLFSSPILATGLVAVALQQSPYVSLADLKDRRLGIPASQQEYPTSKDLSNTLIIPFKGQYEGLSLLKEGQFDAILLPNYEAQLLAEGIEASAIRIISHPLTSGGLYFVVKKENQSLLQSFEKGISALKEKGRYQAIARRWRVYP